MKITAITAAMVTLTGLFALADASQAKSLYRTDMLVNRLQGQTAGLVHELRWGYQTMPQFKHLESDAVEMYKLTRHIHDVVHTESNLDHIAADVVKLDKLFHHVEKLVDEMSIAVKIDIDKQIDADFGPDYRGRYLADCPTSDPLGGLKWQIEAIQRTLHYLMDDVGVPVVKAAPVVNVQPVGNVPLVENVPPVQNTTPVQPVAPIAPVQP